MRHTILIAAIVMGFNMGEAQLITSVQSGNWNDPATWSTGNVPTATDNVTISAGHTVTIDANSSCNDIGVIGQLRFEGGTGRLLSSRNFYVHGDGIVFVDVSTAFHTINVAEDVTNDGAMNLSGGGSSGVNLEFTGSGDQLFSGTGITDLAFVTVNSVTSTATVLMQPDNLTVQGTSSTAPGFLNLTRGNARLAGDFPLESILFTSGSPVVPTSSALWLDNPNLVVQPQNGQLTVQGTLRVSGGVLNVGEDQDDCIILAPGSTFITEGGAVNVSAAIGVASPSHSVKFTQTGGTIAVQRFGNSSTTFAGFDLGTSSFTQATSTAGTIVVEQANTALTGPGDFRVPLGFNVTGGTLQLGNASTDAPSTFRIRGAIPNLVVDQTFNHTVRLAGPATFVLPTTIPSGATLDLNGNGLSLRRDLDITAGAMLNATTTGSALTFGGTLQQSYNNDGALVDGFIRSIVVNNSSGTSPAVAINDDVGVSNSLFLTYGSLGGTGTLTLGNSAASTAMTMTRVNGSMLSTPVFNLDGVTFNANYNNSTVQTATGPELPTILPGTLTINNTAGVYLNVTTTATTVALTNGELNTADSRMLIVSGTSPSNLISTSGFVHGPVAITLPPDLDGTVDYTVPVGETKKQPVTLVAPKTDPTPNTRVYFSYNYFEGGQPGDGISLLPDGLRWFVTVLTGEGGGNITETRVRFSEGGYGNGHRIAKAGTIDGTYNSIGGSVSGGTITSDIFNSFSYFAVGLTTATRSGVYTVGSGGSYPTITAAAADLDTTAMSGPVTLSLTDTLYSANETFPIILKQIAGASATNTLTIKPASSVTTTISGAPFISSIFKLAGARYVTIDGSNNGTDSRNMTVNNTYGGGGYGIWLASSGAGLGAQNNTIKNLVISAGADQSSSNTYTGGILVSGDAEYPTVTTGGADQDSNLIHNNVITKARYGILLRGLSGNPNDGNVISSNTVGPDAFGPLEIGKTGILVQYQNGVQVINNEVRFVGVLGTQSFPEAASEDKVGIGLGTDTWPSTFSASTLTNAVVTGNTVHDIIEEKTQSAVGILVEASGSPTNNLIANNMIFNVRANGTSGNQGVGLGISSANGDKAVFNSIQMAGDVDPDGTTTTATGSNAGLRISGGSNLIVKNNMISADLTSNTGTLSHYALVAPSFYNWGTGGLDYNVYHIDTLNTQMKLGGIGSSVPYTGYADLTAWRTNFSAVQDGHSKSFLPDFTSATNLHLNIAASDTNYAGTPITGVTTDIDGETRSANFPYRGADEVTAFPLILPPQAPILAFPAHNATAQPTSISPKWNPSVGATGYQFQISISSLFETTLVSDSTLTDTTIAISSLTNNTDYFWRVLAYNSAGASPYSTVSSFRTVALPPAAPTNLAAAPGNHQASLTWSKNNEPNIMRYRIFSGTSPNPTTAVDSTIGGVNDTSKTITGLTNGVTYYFRVTALDSSFQESPYSNEVSAIPSDTGPPAAPSGLAVTDSSSRTIAIKWLKNSDPDFLLYRIYRGTTPAQATKVDSATAGVGDTSKTFTGLTNGTRYYLRVTAVDSAGNESGYSNEVNAVPADRIAPSAPQNLVVVDSSSTQIGIKWARNAEADFLQYVIYQGASPNPTAAVDTTSGGATDTSTTITGLTNGTRYYFRVSALDSAGNQSPYSNEVNAAPNTPTGIEDLLSQIPKEYSLAQNYPNPFNPSTVIRYGLPERSSVKIEVYDILGRRIALLVDREQEARYYEVLWNAPVSSGIYFYRIHAVAVANPERKLQRVMKMIMMK